MPIDQNTIGREQDEVVAYGRQIISSEIEALSLLTASLDGSFADAVGLVISTSGQLVISGVGKSGHVARKIAGTFASTGTPAVFLHPAEAAHGDAGVARRGDAAILISYSGGTSELKPLMSYLRAAEIPIIGMTSQRKSALAEASTIVLSLPSRPEAGPFALAPTTSAVMSLALGDALAMSVMKQRNFTADQFRVFHPSGSLGMRLTQIRSVMRAKDRLPLVSPDASMGDVIIRMSEHHIGIAGVLDHEGNIIGSITDGDLRRNINGLLDRNASYVMAKEPKTATADLTVIEAIEILEKHSITSLFVVECPGSRVPIGLIHIHDLLSLPM